MSEQEQEQFETEDFEQENQEQDEHRDDDESESEQEAEQFEIVVDGEEPEQHDDEFHGKPAPEWVKKTREENRSYKKRIKELEAQVSSNSQPKKIELGEKPTLESVGYDTDEFELKITEWHANKAQVDQQEQAAKAEQEKAAQQWQERVVNFETKKTALKAKVHDYDEAEEVARDTLNPTQQGILIDGADNPEMLFYHLGKNPQKARELADTTNPIQFAFKVAKIDAQLKVQARKPSTSPERKPSGSAPLNGVVDAKEAALEKEAQRTGDRTALIQYRKSKKGK